MNTAFLDKLNERYAAKAMNGQSVDQEVIDRIVEAARMAPTSSGLQPFEVLVVSNPELKAEMRKIAFDQPQVTDCSHVLVFAAWDNYTADRINYMFDLTNDVRGFKSEGWENYRQFILNAYVPRSKEENFNHTARQTYIAFMAAMTQAVFEGVDSTPMEGFEADKLDALLGLDKKGLKSTVILPLGYRDEANDWLVKLPKVRKSMEDFATHIN